jgi:hypothetical protein
VEAAAGASRVALPPPVLDDDLGLLQRKEYLPIQRLVSIFCSEILKL